MLGAKKGFGDFSNGPPSRIQYYELDPPKIGRAPITSMISDTYRTISVKLYW